MDSYLTLVERISNEKTGLNADLVFDKFTAGAARPIIRCKDAETETKALNYVIACLKRDETVTGGDLQASINMWLGKPEKKSTQMRTPEPVPEARAGPDTPAPLSLADRERQREMDEAGRNQQVAKEKPQCPAGGEQCQNCPEPCRVETHVNPGPAVMVNPVFTPDTLRESPFQTAAQLKAHDADPLGIGPAPADPVPAAPAEKIDPAKELKERRNRLAKELAATYSERTQRDIQDLIHENPTWRNEEADVFYFGVEALRNPPKVSVSAGAVLRRS
jgi:hypothetical protein